MIADTVLVKRHDLNKDGIDVKAILSPITKSVDELYDIIIFHPIAGKILSAQELLEANKIPYTLVESKSLTEFIQSHPH
jgi:hypothetical protein